MGLPERFLRAVLWCAVAAGLLVAVLVVPAAAQDNDAESEPGVPPEDAGRPAAADGQNRPSLRLVPLEADPGGQGSGPIRVVGNFYFDLPGLDTTTLTPRQKERFLQRVNTEYCNCGRSNCYRDPVANCYINDPGCHHAKVQAKRILQEVKAGK
jgi:hypothetical protein